MTGGQGPARGLRPRFPITHGTRTPRVYGALARELAAGIVVDRPDLSGFPEAVATWAQSEAQAALIRRHIAETGWLDGEGEPRRTVLSMLRTFENLAARSRSVLGLDPLADARLAVERASAVSARVSAEFDLRAVAEVGRAALAAAGLPAGPDRVGELVEAERAAYVAEDAERRGLRP